MKLGLKNLQKMAKYFYGFVALLLVAGCGMSESERINLAKVTCSVMGESRNMDSAFRVKEINAAREKLGGEVYLRGDSGIKESLEHGLCVELVLDNVAYPELLADAIITAAADRMMAAADERRLAEERNKKAREEEEERKRIAAGKLAEERRQKAKEARLAEEKLAQERKIVADKKAKEARLAAEKKAKEKAEEERLAAVKQLSCEINTNGIVDQRNFIFVTAELELAKVNPKATTILVSTSLDKNKIWIDAETASLLGGNVVTHYQVRGVGNVYKTRFEVTPNFLTFLYIDEPECDSSGGAWDVCKNTGKQKRMRISRKTLTGQDDSNFRTFSCELGDYSTEEI